MDLKSKSPLKKTSSRTASTFGRSDLPPSATLAAASASAAPSAAKKGSSLAASPSKNTLASVKSTGGAFFKKTYTYEEIAERARKLWQERGCPEGQDERIWLDAEQSLYGKMQDRSDECAFADPEAPLDMNGDPNDDVDARLDQVASPTVRRSATSL